MSRGGPRRAVPPESRWLRPRPLSALVWLLSLYWLILSLPYLAGDHVLPRSDSSALWAVIVRLVPVEWVAGIALGLVVGCGLVGLHRRARFARRLGGFVAVMWWMFVALLVALVDGVTARAGVYVLVAAVTVLAYVQDGRRVR